MIALLVLAPIGAAQTLADVTLAAAIASELYPGVRLPSGTFRAEGPGGAAFVASLPDVDGYGEWEVYTVTGVVARLQPAFVREVANAFAVAGLFQTDRVERSVGGESHTRYVFSDGTDDAILYVVAIDGAVTWAIGRKGR